MGAFGTNELISCESFEQRKADYSALLYGVNSPAVIFTFVNCFFFPVLKKVCTMKVTDLVEHEGMLKI